MKRKNMEEILEKGVIKRAFAFYNLYISALFQVFH